MPLTPHPWAGGGQAPRDPARTHDKGDGSGPPNPVSLTDECAVAACYDKPSLCRYLRISTRTWDRLAAAGLTPAPDLVISRSARWSPETIARWLKSKPRLRGRASR
jgi:hypothetical protein